MYSGFFKSKNKGNAQLVPNFKKINRDRPTYTIGATVMSLPSSNFNVQDLQNNKNIAYIDISWDRLAIAIPKSCKNPNYLFDVVNALKAKSFAIEEIDAGFEFQLNTSAAYKGKLVITNCIQVVRFLKEICEFDDLTINNFFAKVIQRANCNVNQNGTVQNGGHSKSNVVETLRKLELENKKNITKQQKETAKESLKKLFYREDNKQLIDNPVFYQGKTYDKEVVKDEFGFIENEDYFTDRLMADILEVIKKQGFEDSAIENINGLLECSLSLETFLEPVFVKESGWTYERSVILAHLQDPKNLDPKTNLEVKQRNDLPVHQTVKEIVEAVKILLAPEVEENITNNNNVSPAEVEAEGAVFKPGSSL